MSLRFLTLVLFLGTTVVDGAEMSKVAAVHKGRRLGAQRAVDKPKPKPAAPKPAGKEEAASDDGEEEKAAAPQVSPLVGKLRSFLGELVERRENVVHLEDTLKQEGKMLRESRKMAQVATTKKGKRTYEKQVTDSQKIYKDTFDLYLQSRSEAQTAATDLAAEMQKAKEVEDEIIAEANKQLKHYEAGHMRSALEDSDDDDDDDSAAPKRQALLARGAKAEEEDDDDDDDN